MQAVEFVGGSQSRLVTKPVPEPVKGHAVVKVSYNSICGSDLWLYRGMWHGNTYPVVPGHEWSGVVSATAAGDESWLGARVVGELATGCGACTACRACATVMCADVEEIGFTCDGAMAEFVQVPIVNLHRVPDSVTDLAACQVEPLAVALHAIDRLRVGPGDRVAVFGCGAIGLLLLQSALAVGAQVVLATDPVKHRRHMAEQLGAQVSVDPTVDDLSTFEGSVDVVLEASGDPTSVQAALRVAAVLGRVGLVGYQVGKEAPIATAQWPLKMLTVAGVMGPANYYRPAIDLMARGVLDVTPMLTHVEPLSAHEEAINRAVRRDEGVIRVVFAPQE